MELFGKIQTVQINIPVIAEATGTLWKRDSQYLCKIPAMARATVIVF
jgi:hypothetical protein